MVPAERSRPPARQARRGRLNGGHRRPPAAARDHGARGAAPCPLSTSALVGPGGGARDHRGGAERAARGDQAGAVGREGPRGAAGRRRARRRGASIAGAPSAPAWCPSRRWSAPPKEEAERILAEADQQSREIRLEAEDYVDAKLAQFEIALEKTADALRPLDRPGPARAGASCAARRRPRRSSAAETTPPHVRRRGGGVTVTRGSRRPRPDRVSPAPRARSGVERTDRAGMATELAAVPEDRPVARTCSWRAWSRASWSPAPCRVRWTCRARGACARSDSRSRSRCRSCSSNRARRARRGLPPAGRRASSTSSPCCATPSSCRCRSPRCAGRTARGCAPRCGGDRNLGECTCEPERDERWDVLSRIEFPDES